MYKHLSTQTLPDYYSELVPYLILGKPSKNKDDPDYVPSIFVFSKVHPEGNTERLSRYKKFTARRLVSSNASGPVSTTEGRECVSDNAEFSIDHVSSNVDQSIELLGPGVEKGTPCNLPILGVEKGTSCDLPILGIDKSTSCNLKVHLATCQSLALTKAHLAT